MGWGLEGWSFLGHLIDGNGGEVGRIIDRLR